jgi:membrane protease subunit (stomatin/prohibitin family)
MGFIKDQLRSVIEWSNPDPTALFVKWTDDGDEIKNASKLIVGPGQGCIFVYEGRVQEHYDKEGLVKLDTQNIPFWTTVKSVLQRFESEHKVGLYFYRRAEIANVRWGTPSPIKYRDPQYKFPVGLGAFGNFSVRVLDPVAFFKNMVAGADTYDVRQLQTLIISRITALITDVLGKAKFSYIDIDGHRGEISEQVSQAVLPVFTGLGFQLTDFRIEGTNFDEETQERIGRISDATADAQAATELGLNYAQVQQLAAMRDAAKTQNSTAGTAMGLTAGIGFAQMLGGMFPGGQQPGSPFGQPQAPQPQAAPPPAADDLPAKLGKLKQLFEAGLISDAEYAAKKKEILEKF